MGTTVNATTSDANKLKEIVKANSVKICPINPLMKTTGTNTASVVNVDAIIAPPISFAPSEAALSGLSP